MERLSFSGLILAGLLLMGFALGVRLADIFVLRLDELYSWARLETITRTSWGWWKLSHKGLQIFNSGSPIFSSLNQAL